MKSRVQRGQQAPHAVADDRHVGLAASLLNRFDAFRDEVEHVVLEPQALVLRPGRTPVDHVDVEAAVQQELDQALPRRQVEDVRLADQRHDQQDRRPVDLVHTRPVVVQAKRTPAVNGVLRRQPDTRVSGPDVLQALDAAPEGALHLAPHALLDAGHVQGRPVDRPTGPGCRCAAAHRSDGGRRVRAGRAAWFCCSLRPTAAASSASIRCSRSSTAVRRSESSATSVRVGTPVISK